MAGKAALRLDPLALRTVEGELKLDSNGDFAGTVKVEVGLSATAEFDPLFLFDGQLEIDSEAIRGNGKIIGTKGNLQGETLFNGGFAFARGQKLAQVQGGASFSLAGLRLKVFNVGLVNGALTLQGRLEFPKAKFGSAPNSRPLSVAIDGAHHVRISDEGVELTGGLLTLPDFSGTPFGESINVKGQSMSVEYIAEQPAPEPGKPATPEQIRLRGNGTVELGSATVKALFAKPAPTPAVPSPPDAYIAIKRPLAQTGGLDVDLVGAISAENFKIGKFEFRKVSLAANTETDTLKLGAELVISSKPTQPDLVLLGSGGFLNGEFDSFSVGLDGIQKPVGPIVLQKVEVGVNNIANPAALLELAGTIGFTVGPRLSIPVDQQFAGVRVSDVLGLPRGTQSIEGALISGSVAAKLTGESLALEGKALVVGATTGGSQQKSVALLTGTGRRELNWSKGLLDSVESVQSIGNLFSGDLRFRVGTDLNLSASGSVTLRVPPVVPFLRGKVLLNSGAAIQYVHNATSADDFLATWSEIPGFGLQGLKLRFDGKMESLGSRPLPPVPVSQVPRQARGEGEDDDSATFAISGTPDYLGLEASWETPNANATVLLTLPDGTVLDSAAIDARPDISLVASLSDDTHIVLKIDSPDAGDWSISLADFSGLGTVEYAALMQVPAPTIELTAPVVDQATSQVDVTYEAFDADSDAEISFFLDTDRQGHDGFLLGGRVVEADGPGTFTVDTASTPLPPGDYFIYAVIDDGENVPVLSNYATGAITIADAAGPTEVSNVTARWLGGQDISLNWDSDPEATAYQVGITAHASQPGVETTFIVASTDNALTINGSQLEQPLVLGETYRFEIRAIDAAQRTGAFGGTVITLGPHAELQTEVEQFSAFADPGTTYEAQLELATGDTIQLLESAAGATLDSSSGQFRWDVPVDQTGFSKVVAHATSADGEVAVHRFLLHSQAPRTVAVTGQKFADHNRNGVRDTGESGSNDVVIELVDPVTGDLLASTTTASRDLDGDQTIDPETETGLFDFADLTAGNYLLREVVDPDRQARFGRQPLEEIVELFAGDVASLQLGAPASGSISGFVLDDVDFDGTGDEGYPFLEVFLDLNANQTLDPGEPAVSPDEDDPQTTDIDESGQYRFDQLASGLYPVRLSVPTAVATTSATRQVVNLAADADASADFVVHFAPQGTTGPALQVFDENLAQVVGGEAVDFGARLIDGEGADQQILNLTLQNLGDENLIYEQLLLDDPTGSFLNLGRGRRGHTNPNGLRPELRPANADHQLRSDGQR